jgi:Sulfotransferase family
MIIDARRGAEVGQAVRETREAAVNIADTAKPIIVLGAGHRCGSTLIQRLLSSHPDVMIWGEHLGQLRELLQIRASLRDWSDTLGRRARDMFRGDGYQSFMANLVPDAEHVDDAVRVFVRRLFADPAAAVGRPVWGFKEVRYGRPEVDGLARLFPGLSIIYVIRDPRDVLRSLDEWERQGTWSRELTGYAVDCWHRIAESFLPAEAADDLPVLRLRYEDVVADPQGAGAAIGRHTALDAARFDPEVFGRRITGGRPGAPRVLREWDELPADLRALVDSDRTREIAAGYGYRL